MSIINSSIINSTIIKSSIINSSIIGSGDSPNPLRPIQGWAGAQGCEEPFDTLVTVNFTQDVTYSSHTGVTITHDNGGVFTVSGPAGATTNSIVYTGAWNVEPIAGDVISYNYSGGNYVDADAVPMQDSTLTIINCAGGTLLEIIDFRVVQDETPNGNRIIRSAVIEVKFNQNVIATDTIGITATVHGAEQVVILSGSGTDTLRYRLQRAIYRHEVTWAYNGLGSIKVALGSQVLGPITEKIITNNLPNFTTWDYNKNSLAAPDGHSTDTQWDDDETRFDEVD